MRRLLFLILMALAMMAGSAQATSRIIKVLPQYLDWKGRHALSPSLYERDAYQAFLRDHPADRSAIRFNVQWKSDLAKSQKLKLHLEIRGTKGNSIHTKTLEQPAEKNGWISNWTALELTGEDYQAFGELIAWRATLWDGEAQVAEQKSFLW